MIRVFSPVPSLTEEAPPVRSALTPLLHAGEVSFVSCAAGALPEHLRGSAEVCLLSPHYLTGEVPAWLAELPALAETRLLVSGLVDGRDPKLCAFAAAVDAVLVIDGAVEPWPEAAVGAQIDAGGGASLLAACRRTPPAQPDVRELSQCGLPTQFGDFQVSVYAVDGQEGALLVAMGDLRAAEPALVRVHSECFTGEVLASLKCDCDAQLRGAMRAIAARGHGALVYLRQEGRGIGLANKIAAYAEQQRGADTLEANRRLGFPADLRDFSAAASILRARGVRVVELLTHNPSKVRTLRRHGLTVAKVTAAAVEPNAHNLRYLQVKHDELGHVGLGSRLLRARHGEPEVVLFAPPPSNPLTGGYLFNAAVARLAPGVRARFATAGELRDELRSAPPGARIWALDSLYLADLDPAVIAGHTVVQVVHSLPPPGTPGAERVAAALRTAAGCITTSAFMAGEVVARAASARVGVCRPGVTATPRCSEAGNQTPLVLTVANCERRKGHLALLAALARVRDLPWRWRVIGDLAVDPEHSAAFARALADSGLLPRVQLLGVQTPAQVREAMADAALFALLADNEPYGMVYAESLAAGTPVLAWRQGGVLETVQHDLTGRLVPAGDVAAAASELRELLGAPELRARLRAGCVAAAPLLPTWDACADAFAALCRGFAAVRA